MSSDYVRFARAQGLSESKVVGLHVLKNISIPIVTVFGLELGSTLAFAVVTETVFNWPGMGKLIIDSITVLDRPVMVAYLILVVFLFVMINLVVDLIYGQLDPAHSREGRVMSSSPAPPAETGWSRLANFWSDFRQSPVARGGPDRRRVVVLMAVLAPLSRRRIPTTRKPSTCSMRAWSRARPARAAMSIGSAPMPRDATSSPPSSTDCAPA